MACPACIQIAQRRAKPLGGYDAAEQLEQAAVALKFAAAECEDDLQKYCGNVEVGNGRVQACLDKNEKSLSETCKQALEQTGVKP